MTARLLVSARRRRPCRPAAGAARGTARPRFDRSPRPHVPRGVRDGPAPADRSDQLVPELARALARFDRLREAGAELDGPARLPRHSRQRPELRLLQAEVALRCGRLARAAASVRVLRRTATGSPSCGCAPRSPDTEPGRRDADRHHGRRCRHAAGSGAGGGDRSRADAARRRGPGSSTRPRTRGSTRASPRAQGPLPRPRRRYWGWRRARPDVRRRGAARRGRARWTSRSGSSAWIRRAAAHLELLHRQGRPADAGRAVAAVFDALRESPGVPPRRLVRASRRRPRGLPRPTSGQSCSAWSSRSCDGSLHRAARVVLLAGLRRVPALPCAARSPQLHDLVRDADHDPALAPGDRALLTLTLAELDRLSDRHAEAEAALAFVRDALPSPLARRAWWATLDRLGPPVSRTAPSHDELAAVAAATGDLPMLAAAFLSNAPRRNATPTPPSRGGSSRMRVRGSPKRPNRTRMALPAAPARSRAGAAPDLISRKENERDHHPRTGDRRAERPAAGAHGGHRPPGRSHRRRRRAAAPHRVPGPRQPDRRLPRARRRRAACSTPARCSCAPRRRTSRGRGRGLAGASGPPWRPPHHRTGPRRPPRASTPTRSSSGTPAS